MSTEIIIACASCGKTSLDQYVAPCNFCDRPVCTKCARWIPAKRETVQGVYHDVNRVCSMCKPAR